MYSGGGAHRAACRDDMTGEADWVAFLVVGLGLDWDWIGRVVPERDRVERSYCLARLGGRRSMRWVSG